MENGTLYCKYDATPAPEGAVGRLRIYFPTEGGYIIFSLAHTVREDRNADIWRISQAYFAASPTGEEVPLTSPAAEWDMAILLKGRPDFIGGYAHGDELGGEPVLFLDGRRTDILSLCEPTAFGELGFRISSVGYDPENGRSEVLRHEKEYTVNSVGITLAQRGEWLGDYTVEKAFLAMLPPLKGLTDAYYTDKDDEILDIVSPITRVGVSSVTLFGRKSGFSFTMSIPEYRKGGELSVTDNRTSAYNKAYFSAARDEKVKKGDIWHSVTNYKITRTIKVQNL